MPMGSLESQRPVTGSYHRIIPLHGLVSDEVAPESAEADQVTAVSEEVIAVNTGTPCAGKASGFIRLTEEGRCSMTAVMG